MIAPLVDRFVDEGGPQPDTLTPGERLAARAARETRQQRRMDIDHALRERAAAGW
jgi:hypothetical protein